MCKAVPCGWARYSVGFLPMVNRKREPLSRVLETRNRKRQTRIRAVQDGVKKTGPPQRGEKAEWEQAGPRCGGPRWRRLTGSSAASCATTEARANFLSQSGKRRINHGDWQVCAGRRAPYSAFLHILVIERSGRLRVFKDQRPRARVPIARPQRNTHRLSG